VQLLVFFFFFCVPSRSLFIYRYSRFALPANYTAKAVLVAINSDFSCFFFLSDVLGNSIRAHPQTSFFFIGYTVASALLFAMVGFLFFFRTQMSIPGLKPAISTDRGPIPTTVLVMYTFLHSGRVSLVPPISFLPAPRMEMHRSRQLSLASVDGHAAPTVATIERRRAEMACSRCFLARRGELRGGPAP
jgi:hypothetical protein